MTDNPRDRFYDYLAASNEFAGENETPTVCVRHKRFAPCRPCEREMVAGWSSDPEDVKMVREHQQGT